jgi:hypothetical protein
MLKEIYGYLNGGKPVCFLLDQAPLMLYEPHQGTRSLSHEEQRRAYPALYFVGPFGLSLDQDFGDAIPFIKPHRQEFEAWLNKFGAARYSWVTSDTAQRGGIVPICSLGERLCGFAIPIRRGHLVVVPCAVAARSTSDKLGMLLKLADVLLKFSDNLHPTPPPWLAEFMFEKERPLVEESQTLAARVEEIERQMQRFTDPKRLLYLREYQLQRAVPNTLQEFGFEVQLSEGVEEDFWILESGERRALCEVKSSTANVDRADLGKTLQHRKACGLADDFPAVVFANTFVKAQSLRDKDKQIEPDIQQRAAQDNILVVRTLDLLRLLDQMYAGKMTQEELLDLFKTKRGWLKVNEDGSCEVLGS